MTRAVKDCTYVIHVASPLPAGNPRDDMELIGPAVDGTKSVLEACAKTKGGVKRVVMTSSCAAIIGKRTGAIDPGRATSFPGFSPTRPTERERAGRREPWERGCLEASFNTLISSLIRTYPLVSGEFKAMISLQSI